ncbi:NACHT domain-containing protein [Streptomyces sp. AC563]|uniref:NACHT and WD40 repeat domain-containing protein n=1 Tax=Streptomyces buecherae TaxID=2763006 RepID=UPI00164D624C|nr:WD40 repeat domain-containing protein [Streptomyces buecherae]MBC3989924.1 NACHT domain-containing protein [Streptomyces buecherae]
MLLRTPRRVRPPNTRLARAVSLSLVGVAAAGLTVWMLVHDTGIDVASGAGIVLSLAALVVALLDFFRGSDNSPVDATALADDLAVLLRAQWLEEAGARRLRDERVLPLAWTATRRRVTDARWSQPEGHRVVRLHLDGRLDGRFDEAIDRLADGYARVPNRRLVVVGEPGSGKTVLAVLLTLGLLAAREASGPVPVLLPVASWDPVRERLSDWIVRTMAQPYYSGREDIPRTLLEQGLVLPILDGLDEIPETARRSAIQALNEIGTERPLVVTCRAVEYEELVRGGAPALRQAAVVEVLPVRPEDVVTYLRGVDWPDGVDWAPLLAHLRTEPDSPLSTALSTPLMVTSARLVYQRGGDPGELLDTARFDSSYAVEDHLLKGMVEAAYAPDPRAPAGSGGRWTADQARKWLTYLARHLHGRRERDLAWWQLSERLLSRWAGPLTGLPLGVLLMAAGMVFAGQFDKNVPLAEGLLIAFAYTLVHTAVWHASAASTPRRLSWSVRGSGERLLRGFRTGVAVAALVILPVMTVLTLGGSEFDGGGGGWTARRTRELFESVAVSVTLLTLAGLTFAVRSWLDAPPSSATKASPRRLLAQDRWSAIVSAGAAGVLVTLLGSATLWVGELVGRLAFLALTGAGWPGRADPALIAREEPLSASSADWFTELGPLIGASLTLILLTSRAWPRFLLVRAWLALRGELPWRLMAFLADARRRELLRQVGGVYQFRHIRLQETLAGVPLYPDAETAARAQAAQARARVRRRAVLGVGVGAVSLSVVAGARKWRDDSVAQLALRGYRPVSAVRFRPPSGARAASRPTPSVAYLLEDTTVGLWDGRTAGGAPSTLVSPRERAVVNGPLLFLPDGTTLLVPTRKGSAALSLEGGARVPLPAYDFGEYQEPESMSTYLFAYDARRGYLACGHKGGGVDIRKVRGGRGSPPVFGAPFPLGRLADEPLMSSGLAFLKDGSLAVLDTDGGVARYRGQRFERSELWRLPWRVGPHAFAVTERGGPVDQGRGLLATSNARGVEVWRWNESKLARSTRLPTPPPADSEESLSLAFNPSGSLLAVYGQGSGDVGLYATESGHSVHRRTTFRGHMARVTCLDFSHDGRLLVTGDEEGTIRIWNVRPYSP